MYVYTLTSNREGGKDLHCYYKLVHTQHFPAMIWLRESHYVCLHTYLQQREGGKDLHCYYKLVPTHTAFTLSWSDLGNLTMYVYTLTSNREGGKDLHCYYKLVHTQHFPAMIWLRESHYVCLHTYLQQRGWQGPALLLQVGTHTSFTLPWSDLRNLTMYVYTLTCNREGGKALHVVQVLQPKILYLATPPKVKRPHAIHCGQESNTGVCDSHTPGNDINVKDKRSILVQIDDP